MKYLKNNQGTKKPSPKLQQNDIWENGPELGHLSKTGPKLGHFTVKMQTIARALGVKNVIFAAQYGVKTWPSTLPQETHTHI